MRPRTPSRPARPRPVSIRTRPEGRVRPPRRPRAPAGRACFNPHPPRRAVRPGSASKPSPPATLVSIRTRPEGRVRPYPAVLQFERCTWVSIRTRPEGRVRPRGDHRRRLAQHERFNPHPPRRAGETRRSNGVMGVTSSVVSIRTRPEGRVRREVQHRDRGPHRVSIRTRPEGRVRHAPHLDRLAPLEVSIRTRPEGRVRPRRSRSPLGASWNVRLSTSQLDRFQSAPAPKGG